MFKYKKLKVFYIILLIYKMYMGDFKLLKKDYLKKTFIEKGGLYSFFHHQYHLIPTLSMNKILISNLFIQM